MNIQSPPDARHAGLGPLISLAAASLFLATVTTAQEPRPLNPQWPVPGKLERKLQQLETIRERFERERKETLGPETLGPDAPAETSATPATPGTPPLLQSLQQRLSSAGQQRRMQYQQINQRLDKLEWILSHQRQTEQVPQPLTTPPQPAAGAATLPSAGTEPPDVPIPQADATAESSTTEPIRSQLAPELVTDAAVDRRALADSLFGSGQIELALKLYLELNAAETDAEEQIWVRYQIGCCYRRLHDYAHANEFYRQVVGENGDSPYPKLARWWLDVIDRKVKYLDQLQQVKSFLQTSEASHANAGH